MNLYRELQKLQGKLGGMKARGILSSELEHELKTRIGVLSFEVKLHELLDDMPSLPDDVRVRIKEHFDEVF